MQLANVFRRDVPHFSLLRKQASLCRASALSLQLVVTSKADAPTTRRAIEQLEEESWGIALEMENLLMRQLSAPIDREELHALSMQLAQVLDRTSHVAHACTLVTTFDGASGRMAASHVRATDSLDRAIDAFARRALADVVVVLRDERLAEANEIHDVDAPAKPNDRELVIASQLHEKFGMLARACRTTADLLGRVAVKDS